MRILQIHNPHRKVGGEDTIATTEAEILRAAGCEVRTWSVRNPRGIIPTAGALAAAPWNPRSARRAAAVVASWRPDVVHLHNTWFALSPAVVHSVVKQGAPLVMTLHNYRMECANGQFFRNGRACTDCHQTHPWRGVLHRCYRGSAALSSVAAASIAVNRKRGTWDSVSVFAASSPFMARMAAASGIDPDRIVEHPNVIPDPGKRQGPPSQSRTALFVGRLSPEKGLEIVLRAWRELGGWNGGRLVVIGDGPLREELEAGDWGPGAEFLGNRPNSEILTAMKSARALLFPSQWFECFPRVITEAFATGLPVLATDLGAHGETASQLGPGWTVPAGGDTTPWVAALERLGTDSAAVDRAGLAARRAYEQRYNAAAGVERLFSIYDRARAEPIAHEGLATSGGVRG